VNKCVTMDLKKPGQKLYLVGWTRDELGASQYAILNKDKTGNVPRVDLKLAPQILNKVHDAIRHRMVSACHDLSEGGLAVALAEMAFAGGFGAVVHTNAIPVPSKQDVPLEGLLFGESPTRFLLEVPFEWERSLEILFEGLPIGCIGQVSEQPRLTIFGSEHDSLLINATLAELKQAWHRPLADVV
jgi:phosphoribosylformylglycinamidine synthase subunit PurSL